MGRNLVELVCALRDLAVSALVFALVLASPGCGYTHVDLSKPHKLQPGETLVIEQDGTAWLVPGGPVEADEDDSDDPFEGVEPEPRPTPTITPNEVN